jgi:hypothetical protein
MYYAVDGDIYYCHWSIDVSKFNDFTSLSSRQKELAMFAMLKEIAICIVFLYIVLTIAYANRDPWSYIQHKNYDNIFNEGDFARSIGNYTIRFVDVGITK